MSHDSPEQVELRKGQGDPLIMYLIVRESLNMSVGKIAAQCGHATQMVLLQHFEAPTMKSEPSAFEEWLSTSFRKVVLSADEKEWAKVRDSGEVRFLTVTDAGLTEVPSGSETVMVLWPMRKSLVPKVIKRLQVLK
jgi:PTH2 family peptidyl-tRNA hydrolase